MARMHQRNRWLSFLILMTMLIPVMLYAASDVGTDGLFNFTKDTVISSSEVNKNFDVLGNFMTTYEDAITVDGNGNVGVGTTEPGAKLDIGGWATNQGMRLTYGNATGQVNAINLYANGVSNAVVGMQMRQSPNEGDLFLGGSSGRVMTLASNGNVGIGTTTPATIFHIQSARPEVVIVGEDSAALHFCNSGTPDCDRGSKLYQFKDTFSIIGDGEQNTVINFFTRGSASSAVERMRIDGSGNVGIGTTSPKAKLHLSTPDGVGTTTELLHLTAGGGVNTSGTASRIAGYSDIMNGYIDFKRFTSGGPTTGITMGTFTGDLLTLRSTGTLGNPGNVGINTTDPTYRLDVNGTLRAYGITDASSRQYKDHIRTLEADDALKALTALRPTRYHYKQDNTEERLGFIAEEVPELLAMKDRQGVSSMDVVAVLTKVVQVQQTQLEEQRKQIETLRKQVDGIAATATK